MADLQGTVATCGPAQTSPAAYELEKIGAKIEASQYEPPSTIQSSSHSEDQIRAQFQTTLDHAQPPLPMDFDDNTLPSAVVKRKGKSPLEGKIHKKNAKK